MGKLINKLTDVQIRKWIKAGTPVAISDGGGLTFTLSAGGTSAWILRYRFGGKLKELTIGRYPDKSLSLAREEARKARGQIQNGIDIARQKRLDRVTQASQKSFRELAKDYMDKVFPTLASHTVKQRTQQFNKWILPKLGPLPAAEVQTADVVSLVETVGKTSVNVAEMVLTAISETFKHGIARNAVTKSPCAGISVTAICGRPEPTRQRLMLTKDELRAVLPQLPFVGPENSLAIKILLATATRIGELARAEWCHIDFTRSEWFVPPTNSKTNRSYTVPLPPAVVKWFRELEVLACGSNYVLPARQQRRVKNHEGETFFEQRAVNSMLHKLFDSMEASGKKIRRFTPHDLRSTARSWFTSSEINASVVVAERCLNHTLGGLIAVYDQHDYLDERRSTLEKWTEIILECEVESERETLDAVA